ncbi:MAG: Uma2 family endonuclease [Spirulina sp.]
MSIVSQKYPQLIVPPAISLKISHEDFVKLALNNRELRLERTAAGELIVNPPTGGETGRKNFKLSGQLASWCEANSQLGEGFDSSTGFTLPNGADRSPDASWVSREKWEALTVKQRESFLPICPDFAIELRSKSDTLVSLQGKMQEYLDNGMSLGWLIDPKSRRVEIYRSQREVERLDNPSRLSGENVLPGFVLDLRKIW